MKQPGKTTLRTKEGVDAVKAAIKFLNEAKPVREIKWHTDLYAAAKQHVQDIGPKGLVQHESSDGTTVKERLKRYGKIVTCYGENLSFHSETALDVVLQQIVDDGVSNRGHRENLFNPDFRVMGCYSSTHKDFDRMSTLDFCACFVRNGEEDPIEKQMDAFLKEEVEFKEMPADVRGWKQNSKISVQGFKATKTVTRTCRLKDGSEQVYTQESFREFQL